MEEHCGPSGFKIKRKPLLACIPATHAPSQRRENLEATELYRFMRQQQTQRTEQILTVPDTPQQGVVCPAVNRRAIFDW